MWTKVDDERTNAGSRVYFNDGSGELIILLGIERRAKLSIIEMGIMFKLTCFMYTKYRIAGRHSTILYE